MTTYFELSPDEALVHPRGDYMSMGLDMQFNEGLIDDPPVLAWSIDDVSAPDWIGTVDGMRLVSPTIKRVFTDCRGPRDDIQWVAATLQTTTSTLDYWVPHFPSWPDVYDLEPTTFEPSGLPMRCVLSAAKLDGFAVR